ncbi:MAG: flagellar assembly protein T N-terminal domain-containing protein [Selenomonadaceae bacterium]|nr:flagellar assembly protein T N-terminal domain-containing protein [Selenomonadaceae bacterium]
MNNLLKVFVTIFAVCAFFVWTSSPAEAVIVKGFAPIIDGDIDTAKKEARKQALRAAVEDAVGVHVESTTEVANFMVVKDEISVKSDGYVSIKRVISEEIRGDIVYVELDVEASAQKIREFAQDLKSQLDANVNESNSRGGIMTAVVQKNTDGSCTYTPEFGDYINARLKQVGFFAVTNDNVVEYLIYHASDADVRVKARTIAKDNRTEENALLRGVLEIFSVRKVGGAYEATVNASFELIGLDSNVVDVFNKYVKGAASTEREAVEVAKENATREAIDSLAQQALETVQNETRGGYTNIKTTVVVDNVTNYQAQYPLIKAALENAHCKIIRMTRPSTTTLAFFVSTDSYNNVGELQETLLNAIAGIKLGVTASGELGATKIRLTF